MKTIPQLQQDINLLVSALATTTDMFAQLIPTKEELADRRQQGGGDMSPVVDLIATIARSQIDNNRAVLQKLSEENPDARLHQILDDIKNVSKRLQ